MGLSNFAQGKGDLMVIEDGKGLTNGRQLNDTIGNNKFDDEFSMRYDKKTHYTDYKIITHVNDTIVVDTTLSIKKERLFNHLRKDIFERQSFHNLGSPFAYLGYDFSKTNLFPNTGMRVKHQSYIPIEKVKYYRVPTPTSELFFKTGIQQGQVLNSVLTVNINPKLNLSIAYKGLRSLGDYRNALASHQNFRFTGSYLSSSKRYQMRFHHVAHNLMNRENGGLTEGALLLFTTDDSGFRDRERLATQYTDAESVLKNKRFYLDQSFDLWTHTDTINNKKTGLKLGHEIVFSKKHYKYLQDKENEFIGAAFQSVIADSTYHNKLKMLCMQDLPRHIFWVRLTLKPNLPAILMVITGCYT